MEGPLEPDLERQGGSKANIIRGLRLVLFLKSVKLTKQITLKQPSIFFYSKICIVKYI